MKILSSFKANCVERPLITRFAPSPTGYLHLGHVASAIYVWGIAQYLGAQVILRIEDHDRGRCRLEYDKAILEDIEWLGFVPDLITRQSERYDFYWDGLDKLRQTSALYYCLCTRKEIAQANSDTEAQVESRYAGTCRNRCLKPDNAGLRIELDDIEESFFDLQLGHQKQNPARQCGDLLLRDRDGQWTYQYAVTVDDYLQGVNIIIRGQDLTASTGRQIALARKLGRAKPAHFFHHPLVQDNAGLKLSKRFLSQSIREERARGVVPEFILGQAALEVGLIKSHRPWNARSLGDLFA